MQRWGEDPGHLPSALQKGFAQTYKVCFRAVGLFAAPEFNIVAPCVFPLGYAWKAKVEYKAL